MIHAQIAEAFAFGSDRIAIRFAARDPDMLGAGQYAVVEADDYSGAILRYAPADPGTGTGRPTLALTEPEGRALLEALAAHYGGTGPLQAARDDLLHERGRVDKLLAHLMDLSGDAVAGLSDSVIAALEPPPAPALATMAERVR